MIRQYPLDLRWPSHQRLDTFYPGPNVAVLREVAALATDAARPWVFVHGASGTGKTHLLVGACRMVLGSGGVARYLSLASVAGRGVEMVKAIAAEGFLAIDDVQAMAGDGALEHALFDLYNAAAAARARILIAATVPPAEVGIALPDLVSRLAACTQQSLHPLDDAARRAMLRSLAGRMGLRLDDDVLDWWFARQPRDAASLVALLQRIDRAAFAAQRRVTVPFLRELLRGPAV